MLANQARALLMALTFILFPACASAQSTGFGAPFLGNFDLGNWHDHNVPKEFIDTNGVIVNSEGRSTESYIDGHEGYDWLLPEGTPLLAVADGTVVYAGDGEPFACPILDNQIVVGRQVFLRTDIGGEDYYPLYAHLSQVMVVTGQTVKKGQLLGLSGNTGCSTEPHLHFAVYNEANGPSRSLLDPYGWRGEGTDPWELDPEGAKSVLLWDSGAAPERFLINESPPNPCSACSSNITITAVRWMGPNDAAEPNNDYIELTLDKRYGPKVRDIGGFRIRTGFTKDYKLPRKLSIRTGRPIRVYSGSGRNTKREVYLKQKEGILNDFGDCLLLLDSRQRLQYFYRFGGASCESSVRSERRVPIEGGGAEPKVPGPACTLPRPFAYQSLAPGSSPLP